MSKKILMVLTSHNQLGDTGQKTGFWLEEFAAPYYVFKDAGMILTLASPAGGQPPLDPKSDDPSAQTDATQRFKADKEGQDQLAQTLPLATVKAADYDAIFYPGGHGPLWDLVDNADSLRLIEAFAGQEKPVASVCHGPIVLAQAKTADGTPMVKGRQVTGFSNTEEAAVGLTNIVPLSVEDTLVAKGGLYQKAENWAAFALQDGVLITGQNPASSEATAALVLQAL